MNINIERYNEIVYRIQDRIQDERKAIKNYEHLLSLIHLVQNGSDKRSILHILNEEKDHEVILHKLLKKYRVL